MRWVGKEVARPVMTTSLGSGDKVESMVRCLEARSQLTSYRIQ
jgi:hypothetical protein